MSGPLESSITLDEVFAVVSAKRVPLAPELAGYLVLELAEGAGVAPGEVDPRQVYIGDEGTVALVRPKRADAAEGATEESIRAILQRLLEATGSQTPALDAAAKRTPGAGIPSLSQELESALVPVNRAAGRRALARLAREVKRVTLGVGRNASLPPSERWGRGSSPSFSSLSGSVGNGGAERPVAERPGVSLKRPGRPRDEVDGLLSAFEVESPRPDAAISRDLKDMAGLTPTPPTSFPTSGGPRSANPVQLSAPPRASLARLETPPRRSGNAWLVVLVVAVLAAGGAILGSILRSAPSHPPAEAPTPGLAQSTAKGSEGATAVRRACKATLVVADAPPNAEVLVRVGQAPLDVPRMPVGARLEFVATAEGYVPKRAVVPARATWDGGPSAKPRYDLAVGLERSRAKTGATDAWPPGEPGTEVGGQGPPGTVHISSTPRGAEIWLLTGLGPEATIDQLSCDGDVDVLVAGPGTRRKRLHVAQADFVEAAPTSGQTVPPSGMDLLRKARISAK